mmetsp:Transcript_17529/g.68000  ORF Transcript_17529/g.68000 Transcript_17529/m.68000 type:complete len:250 (+) Transcript_17529:1102-1851(+)
MQSELENLETDCEITVLPQPKAPGIAVVPPCTHGKRASRTRCPVSRGWSPASFSVTGRGTRTGQLWSIPKLLRSPWNSSSKMLSRMVYWPSGATKVRVPISFGGTMILWMIRVFSNTSPMMSPPVTLSPTAKPVGLKCHSLVRLSDSVLTPRGMKMLLLISAMFCSGRWIPSKISPMIPGASSTERGFPVRSTGSPTWQPEVSSYTWMVAVSPSRRIISPTSLWTPTRTSSYMAAPRIFSATTTGPDTE